MSRRPCGWLISNFPLNEEVHEIIEKQPDRITSLIPKVSDKAANITNIAAIDRIANSPKYRYIVGWGKYLGFTPETILKSLQDAEAENAPADAIQKIDGRWFCISDIQNDANRQRVVKLSGDP